MFNSAARQHSEAVARTRRIEQLADEMARLGQVHAKVAPRYAKMGHPLAAPEGPGWRLHAGSRLTRLSCLLRTRCIEAHSHAFDWPCSLHPLLLSPALPS